VAPASTRKAGESFDDGATNTGSFSPDERLWVETMLTPTSAADGQPVPDSLQQLKLHLPSWVVSVLYSAGTNDPLAAALPASIEVPVRYDPTTRHVVGIVVDEICAELQQYRDAAVRQFQRTDSYLAPLRNTAALPGDALAAGKGLVDAWKSGLSDLAAQARAPSGAATACSWTDAEVEAMRRNAAILALRWQNKPKERDKARARALQALPMSADSVRTGSVSAADFEVTVMREEVSTAITPDEAAAFRRAAVPDNR